MAKMSSVLWRLLFLVAGILIILGGPRHPGGTMAQMLADPEWVPAHALMLAGFVALLLGLILYRRALPLPARTTRWVRLAAVGTALQAIEMAFHTAAVVDRANLVAGRATPVLTTHLWLAVVMYPVFAATIVGFILATARDRSLASPWVAWIGALGTLAWGAAAPLAILTDLEWVGYLFPGVLGLSVWLALAAIWPLRATTRTEGTRAEGLSAGA